MTHVSPAPGTGSGAASSSYQRAHSVGSSSHASKSRNNAHHPRTHPMVSARDLLDHFRLQIEDRSLPPEKVSLRGYCDGVEDLTPRTRRTVLNCGVDFHDEVVAMPNLHELPSAARGLAEAEAKWLHHLGRRRFEVVEALEAERSRMITQLSEQREQDQHHYDGNHNQQHSSTRDTHHREGGGGGGGNSPRSAVDSVSSSRLSSPRAGGGGGSSSYGGSQSQTRRAMTPSSMMAKDPAEYQAMRAERREQAMLEAMRKKLEAEERVKAHEERSIGMAQLTLKRQRQQERAAHKARERVEQQKEMQRRERAEHERQKLAHRREVQQVHEQLESIMREQQEMAEAEKEMTVEERRKARVDRLKHRRAELEAKRVEQQKRLVHLQRSIEDVEEARRQELLAKLHTAESTRERNKAKQEEIRAMHAAYEESRTQMYRERRDQLEHAHAVSITRYKDKGEAAVEKRDHILATRNRALKERILQHAQKELQARQLRVDLEEAKEDNARELEDRIRVQQRRSKSVLQHKQDQAKMRLAEKQLVLHDHKMHAVHMQRMQEVREAELARRVEQKMHRIELLREDAHELDQYRRSLRHLLEVNKEPPDAAAAHAHSRPNRSPSRQTRALTPAPGPGPAAYNVTQSDAALQAHGANAHKFGTAPAQQATRMDPSPGPGAYALRGSIRSNVGVTIPPPKTPEPRMAG